MTMVSIDRDAMREAVSWTNLATRDIPEIVDRLRSRLESVGLSYPGLNRWAFGGGALAQLIDIAKDLEHRRDEADAVANMDPQMHVVSYDITPFLNTDARVAADRIKQFLDSGESTLPPGLVSLLMADESDPEFDAALVSRLSAQDVLSFLSRLNGIRTQLVTDVQSGLMAAPNRLDDFDKQYCQILDGLGAVLGLAASAMTPEQLVVFTDDYKQAVGNDLAGGTTLPLCLSVLIAHGAWPGPFLTGIDQAILSVEGPEPDGLSHWLLPGGAGVVDPAVDPLLGIKPVVTDPMYGVIKSAVLTNPDWLVGAFSGNEHQNVTVDVDPHMEYDKYGVPIPVTTQTLPVDQGIWDHMYRSMDDATRSWLSQAFTIGQVTAMNAGQTVPILDDAATVTAALHKKSEDWKNRTFWEKFHHEMLGAAALLTGLGGALTFGECPPIGILLGVASTGISMADGGMYIDEDHPVAGVVEIVLSLTFFVGASVRMAKLSLTEFEDLQRFGSFILADGTTIDFSAVIDTKITAIIGQTDAEVISSATRGVPTTSRITAIATYDSTGALANPSVTNIARVSTINPDTSYVILGKWNAADPTSYEQVGERAAGTYFDMGDSFGPLKAQLMTTMTEDEAKNEIWRINQAFLDDQIAQGKTFYFTKNPVLLDKKSFSFKEYNYLIQEKYSFQEVGDGVWKAVPR